MKSTLTKPVYWHRLVEHLRTPLYRNGYMLMISSGASSALGVVYWILAARFYSPEYVGLNSAIISAMTFLSSVSLLSLNNVLVRYLPISGVWSRRFVVWTYVISVAAAIIAATIFIAGIHIWSPDLKALAANTGSILFWVLALAGSNIFTLQDGALTGLRKTWWIPIENVLFSLTKVVLLLGLASYLPRYGIYVSWVIPVLIAVVPITYLIFVRLLPAHQQQPDTNTTTPSIGELVTYVGGNFVGSTFYFAYATLISLVVVRTLGAAGAAFFYIPWTISSSLHLIALNMSTALTVEAVRDRDNLAVYYVRTVKQSMRLLVPAVAVILVGAPYILMVFGSEYATYGTGLFRLTALSILPGSLTLLYIGVLRAQNRVGVIAVIQGTICIAVFATSTLLLRRIGIAGVGWAVLISQSLVTCGVFAVELNRRRQQHGALERDEST